MSDFARALREADEDLGAPTPSEAARLDERVAQIGRPQPRRTAPVLALAAIAASLLLFFFLRGEVVSSVSPGLSAAAGRSLPTERALPAPSLPPRFELREASGDADYQDDHGVLAVARGELTLDHPEAAMTLTLAGPARLRPEPWGVTVERGTIRFEVARGKGRREVAVSGGVIEITGTRFVVTEDGRRGKVELEEGSIRFHRGHPRGDETVTPLTPGESLSWQAEAPSDDDAVDEAGPRLARGAAQRARHDDRVVGQQRAALRSGARRRNRQPGAVSRHLGVQYTRRMHGAAPRVGPLVIDLVHLCQLPRSHRSVATRRTRHRLRRLWHPRVLHRGRHHHHQGVHRRLVLWP